MESRRIEEVAKMFTVMSLDERRLAIQQIIEEHSFDFREVFSYTGERFNNPPYDTKNPPRMTVSRKGSFDAAHNNPKIGGKCTRLHGHRFEYEVICRGPVNPETGLVVDFRHLKEEMKNRIENRLDHAYLNEVLPFLTSCEHVCVWIYTKMKEVIPEVYAVRLWETDKAYAEVTSDDFR